MAESEVRDILFATTPERVERFPESVVILPVAVAILAVIAFNEPVMEAIVVLSPFTVPERALCARESVK